MKAGRYWREILFVIVLSVLTVIGCVVLTIWYFSLPQHRVDALMAEYRKAPSQATAIQLTRLLDEQMVSDEKGSAILECLVKPQLTVRSSYRVGHPAACSLTIPFPVTIQKMDTSVKRKTTDSLNKLSGEDSVSGNGGNFSGTSFLFLSRVPTTPGIYRLQVLYDYRLVPGKMSKKKEAYACSFVVPVDFRVVEEKAAETVKLVSNPGLDLAMRRAFRVGHSKVYEGSYGSSSGNPIKFHMEFDCRYSSLPMDAVFNVSFVEKDGKKIRMSGSRSNLDSFCVLRSGNSRELILPFSILEIEDIGFYEGTMVFKPDVEDAYRDPSIKEIWGGTLEFPVTLTVSAGKPPAPAPKASHPSR